MIVQNALINKEDNILKLTRTPLYWWIRIFIIMYGVKYNASNKGIIHSIAFIDSVTVINFQKKKTNYKRETGHGMLLINLGNV